MNHYAMQRNAFAASRDLFVSGDRKSPVLCPKPRRLGPTPLRCHASHQAEPCLEILDYPLPKGAGEFSSLSPPFFSGSPPSRAGNPVVRDARFGEFRTTGPLPSPATPVAVRIEGFDCRPRGCGITAVA